MASKKIYAVKKGRKTGLFDTWSECEAQVKGFNGAIYKSFQSKAEAEDWMGGKRIKEFSGIHLFVDGSFSNKSPYGGWGLVIVEDGKEIASYSGRTKEPALSRNIDGELEAAYLALKWLEKKGVSGTIHFDYQGIESWYTGAWKAKSEIALKYLRRIQGINVRVNFHKVKAHSGNKFNDRADELAKKGITEGGE